MPPPRSSDPDLTICASVQSPEEFGKVVANHFLTTVSKIPTPCLFPTRSMDQ